MDRKGKLVNVCFLPAQIIDSDFWIRHSATEARLWVRLVLAVPVALCWTTTHFGREKHKKEDGGARVIMIGCTARHSRQKEDASKDGKDGTALNT